jgi:hypothetical protein
MKLIVIPLKITKNSKIACCDVLLGLGIVTAVSLIFYNKKHLNQKCTLFSLKGSLNPPLKDLTHTRTKPTSMK